MRKGSRQSEEAKKKISEHHKGLLMGELNPSKRPEIRLKISLALKGKPFSEERCQKLSRAQIKSQAGRNGNAFRGDNVSYRALHYWVERKLGSPKECAYCGTREMKRIDGRNAIQYANVSHNYKRELTDWIPLCNPCHGKYDTGYRRHLI
jgi:hypothetical protein